MTRGERITTAFGVGFGCAVAAVFATGALAWLNNRLEFSAGANVIQWISGPATFAAVVAVVYQYVSRMCATPRCYRRGEHPVDGTLEKVCKHHHTLEHHQAVHARHGAAHTDSGRLHWGQSHGGVA